MSGIACNILVCLGIFISSASRNALGRFILASVFVIIGYDHVVANMAFVPLDIYYGANVTTIQYIIFSMIPSLIGNIIGGGCVVGCLFVYLYSWTNRRYKSISEWLHYNFVLGHNYSLHNELADFQYQLFHTLPRKKPDTEIDVKHATAQPAATSRENKNSAGLQPTTAENSTTENGSRV